ncbi:MAG: TetR/AcrR family transcriptional regulator [Rhizobacter sp.]|nr:TetR/AcrR family transcriptional regulator [Rhizobacter sp.]
MPRQATAAARPSPRKPVASRVRRGHAGDHADFRQAVEAAALALYKRHGLAGVTMRAVATEVGVSAMGLYRHYQNKSDLLTALWHHVLTDLLSHLRQAVDAHTAARDRQRASVEAFLDYFETRADHFRLLYMTEHTSDAAAGAEIREATPYRELLDHGRALDQALARTLRAKPTADQFRLAMELRVTLCVGYLHSHIVNRRLTDSARPALREQVVLSALQGGERCLTTAPTLS